MRRKIIYAVIGEILGIAMAQQFDLQLCILLLIITFLIYYLRKSRKLNIKSDKIFHKKVIILAVFYTIGVIVLEITDVNMSSGRLYTLASNGDEKYVEIEGIVHEAIQMEEDRYKLKVSVAGENILINHCDKLNYYGNLPGKHVKLSVKPEKPMNAGNPRCFDYSLYLKSKGIWVTGTCKTIDIDYNSTQHIIYSALNKIRIKRDAFLKSLCCNDSTEAFLEGVLFGNTDKISEDIYDEFRENGTAHVLAVSGLHIGILYGLYRIINKKSKRKINTIVFLITIFLYGTAAMWSVSVVRATLVIILKLISDYTDRRYDMLSAVSAIGLCAMNLNPYVLFNPGFQMSFLAVVSICFLAPFFERWIGKTFSVVIAVQIGLAPYIAYTYNYISLSSFFCNIIVVFLVSILVPLGILSFFIFFFTGFEALPLYEISDALSGLILFVNKKINFGGTFTVDVTSPNIATVILIYGLIFFMTSEHMRILVHRKMWKRITVIVASIGLVSFLGYNMDRSQLDRADIVFVDVGQGDCVHMKVSRERNVIIDGGGSLTYNIGKKMLKPYLLKNGVGEINLALCTHTHTDHFRGIKELSEIYPVKKITTSGKSGQRINLSEHDRIDVIWPEQLTDGETTLSRDENLNSMVFRVDIKGISVLITGDITSQGESYLVDKYRNTDVLKCDILKIAHHGSKYSSSDSFIDAVSPKIAVISVGRNNYGHPAKEVIEKLEKKGIIVVRTDRDGAIGFYKRKDQLVLCRTRM